jgi:protein arginine kinase
VNPGQEPQLDEWIALNGPDSDVVFCTRVRLARNIETASFSPTIASDEAGELLQSLRESMAGVAQKHDWSFTAVDELPSLDRQVLLERHLISREFAESELPRGVYHDAHGRSGCMLNEEDHLRLQVFRSGLQLEEAWEAADLLDDEVSDVVPYAFHQRYGFLTACPTNTGTGMRASVLLHLPALVLAREIEKAAKAVQDLQMAVRGLYGEGSRAVGDLFQLSNQRTLGVDEDRSIENLGHAVATLVDWEKRQRESHRKDPLYLQDRAHRALGVLQHAQRLSSEEALELVSQPQLHRHRAHPARADPRRQRRRGQGAREPRHLPRAVRSQVEEIIGQGGSSPSGHIPFTPRAKKVLELSLREALQLGHNYIGTEHILLGLIREGEGVAAQVLVKLGADLSRVRQQVIQLLSGYQGPSRLHRRAAAASMDAAGAGVGASKGGDDEKGGNSQILDQFGRNLTQLAREASSTP